MNNYYWIITIAVSLMTAAVATAEDNRAPAPILTQTKELFYEDSFDTVGFDESVLAAQEKSRWNVKDGVLLGQPSPVEYQRIKGGHNGASPLLQFRTPGPCFCMSLRMRFNGTGIAYQGVGFGISRYGSTVRLSALGSRLSVHKLRMMHDPEHKLVAGRWYDCTYEILGDEIAVQFHDGPTLYGKHDTIYGKHGTTADIAKEGITRRIFQIKGAPSGTIELDDLRIWSVQGEPSSEWPAMREKLVACYQQKHGHELNTLDRKETASALKALAEKDPNWDGIQAARAAESEIRKAGLVANKQKFNALSPDEQEAKRRRKAELLEKRKAAKAEQQPRDQ